jgi:choline dehydrogenase-like flavoprotein
MGTLSRAERRTLRRFAETLLPTGGALPLGAADVDTASAVEGHVARLPRRFRVALRLGLRMWEYLPLLSRHRRRFSRLGRREREEYLVQSQESRFPPRHLLCFWLKTLCLSAFLSDLRVEQAIGLSRSCLDRSPPEEGPRLKPISYPSIRGNVEVRADACVVGSGAGGAVVAKELAEGGMSVVVIEEGAYFRREDYAQGTAWGQVQKLYRDSGLTLAWGEPAVPIPLGKAVGGTTVVNSGTCFRTPEKVLREWERDWGLEGIDSDTMAPLFQRVEETISVRPVPWEIIGNNARVFDRGVKALGYHGQPLLRNIDGCRGCGVCSFGCPSDAKQAMHLSYLPRAARAGAMIYARCRARRILAAHGRVQGVKAEILDGATDEVRGQLTVRAPTVVLAAGAIHTPALLMANDLALGSGQVGRNLRVHPAVGVSAVFEEDVYAWRGTLQSYYVDDLQESHGVLLEVTSLLPGVGAALMPEVGPKLKQALGRYKHLASAGLFVADSSKGRVLRGWGRGWWSSPIVLYSLNRNDAQCLKQGIALAAEVFLAAGATAVSTGIRRLAPITERGGLEALKRMSIAPGQLSPAGFHPMGTCRMGHDPASSVVGPWGEAHGVPGLYIADASIFPSCAGVNPQVSIMAFATRTAFHILRRGA